jgi:hypothetical protein
MVRGYDPFPPIYQQAPILQKGRTTQPAPFSLVLSYPTHAESVIQNCQGSSAAEEGAHPGELVGKGRQEETSQKLLFLARWLTSFSSTNCHSIAVCLRVCILSLDLFNNAIVCWLHYQAKWTLTKDTWTDRFWRSEIHVFLCDLTCQRHNLWKWHWVALFQHIDNGSILYKEAWDANSRSIPPQSLCLLLCQEDTCNDPLSFSHFVWKGEHNLSSRQVG